MEKKSAAKPVAPQATFHGISPNGYLRLVYCGKKYIGVGTLFVMRRKTGTDGRIARFFRRVHETPTELVPPRRQPVSIECIGVHDQKRYRFRGLLKPKKHDALRSPMKATPAGAAEPLLREALSASTVVNKLPPAHLQGDASQSAVSTPAMDTKKQRATARIKARHRPQDTDAAIAELKWVKAMIEACIDANVKLSTICLLSSKSRATLERELTQGRLPPPRIRGRLRYWSLNDVHAYLTGTWPSLPAL